MSLRLPKLTSKPPCRDDFLAVAKRLTMWQYAVLKSFPRKSQLEGQINPNLGLIGAVPELAG
jgi:hypothetical protein